LAHRLEAIKEAGVAASLVLVSACAASCWLVRRPRRAPARDHLAGTWSEALGAASWAAFTDPLPTDQPWASALVARRLGAPL